MQETTDRLVKYLTDNFTEDFYVDSEDNDKEKIIYIQFLMKKIDNIDNIINFMDKINDSKKDFCKKYEIELLKTNDNTPIFQINYYLI